MRRLPTFLLAMTAVAASAQAPPAGEPARQIMDAVPAAGLQAMLGVEPERALALYGELARTLGTAEGESLVRLRSYLTEVARAHGQALGERGAPVTEEEAETLLILQLVDPPRFVAEPEFRRRAMPVLLGSLDPQSDPALREAQLYLLTRLRDFDFVAAEQLEVAWGTVLRSTRPAKVPFGDLRLAVTDSTGPIAGSVYSLPSRFFTLEESAALLRAVRRLDPERALVVLADRPLREGLAELGEDLDLTLIDTRGRPYSPWARDPMSFRRDPEDRLVILLRPNLQLGREADARLGLQLLQNLPEKLERAWGPVRWSVPPVPFHNGQILPLAGATWISIHSLEQRVERLLSVATGSQGYPDAVRRAADELAGLYGLPPRWVHPPVEEDAAAGALAGGAGFDLDSLLTLLPGSAGITALVADLEAGSELVDGLTVAALETFRRGYGLAAKGDGLRRALIAAQGQPRASNLQRFLDTVARHLAADGRRVERLPLLLVPTALLEKRQEYASQPDFLVTWNNVVLERQGDRARAEGFSSLIDTGDAAAVSAFERAGYRLDLLPPLIESVLRYGGYRCASNHVR